MTLIIRESLREIGEVACVTSAWSSRGQTLKASHFMYLLFQDKLCHIDILKDVIRKIMDIVQAAPVCGWHAVYGQYRNCYSKHHQVL